MEKDDYKAGELVHPNGYVLSEAEVNSYNNYTVEINAMVRMGNKKAEAFLRNNRHQYFQLVADSSAA